MSGANAAVTAAFAQGKGTAHADWSRSLFLPPLLLMRRFRDSAGSLWDVVLGRASWGSLSALFVPAGHDAVVRQTPFQPNSPTMAEAELNALDDAALSELFERSTPKED